VSVGNILDLVPVRLVSIRSFAKTKSCVAFYAKPKAGVVVCRATQPALTTFHYLPDSELGRGRKQRGVEVINLRKHYEPYDNDSMMKKLHDIHHQIYEETKNMTSKEITNKINQEAEQFLREMGYSLVPTGIGRYRLVDSARSKHSPIR